MTILPTKLKLRIVSKIKIRVLDSPPPNNSLSKILLIVIYQIKVYLQRLTYQLELFLVKEKLQSKNDEQCYSGPYEGILTQNQKETESGGYAWELRVMNSKASYYLDGNFVAFWEYNYYSKLI